MGRASPSPGEDWVRQFAGLERCTKAPSLLAAVVSMLPTGGDVLITGTEVPGKLALRETGHQSRSLWKSRPQDRVWGSRASATLTWSKPLREAGEEGKDS